MNIYSTVAGNEFKSNRSFSHRLQEECIKLSTKSISVVFIRVIAFRSVTTPCNNYYYSLSKYKRFTNKQTNKKKHYTIFQMCFNFQNMQASKRGVQQKQKHNSSEKLKI